MDQQNNQFDSQAADHSRFLTLFVREQRKIYSYLLMMLHNHADAEDLMQETAIILWEKFPSYDPERSFLAWSIGIARHVVLRFREANKHRRVILDERIYASLEAYAENHQDQQEDMVGALRKCIQTLKQADRDLVDLRYGERAPVRQIAAQINRSLNGLYQSYARIHGVLQTCLQRRLGEQRL